MSQEYVVGVDLGGTNARAGVAGRDGKILQETSRPSESSGPAEGTFDVIAQCIKEVVKAAGVHPGCAAAIGVGLPGIVMEETCAWSPNFPQWKDVPIRKLMESRAGVRSYFLNDARCATLAEQHFGAGRGVSSMVFVGLGTGIGGGIVLDNQLLLGRNGSVGEIAHHTIDPAGERCGCGNFGCWETFCGRDYIVKRAQRKLQAGRASVLAADSNGGRSITPRDIADAAKRGDAAAMEVMDEVGCYLGIGIANLVSILDPERVVIGGGIAQAGDLLLEPVRRTVRARAVPFQGQGCEIVPAALGSSAGLQGAVALAMLKSGWAIDAAQGIFES